MQPVRHTAPASLPHRATPDRSTPRMAFLVHGDQRRQLGPGVLSIGSGVEAGWRFRVPELLRLHALVTQDAAGRPTVVRATADADVVVNGEPIGGEVRRLAPGDTLTVGPLDFRLEGDAPVVPTPGPGGGYLRDARRDRVHRLLKDSTLIGRDQGADLLLQEPEIARVHLRIERDGDTIRALPQQGAVTLLNGARLDKPVTLKDNDALGLGRTVYFFTHDAPKRHPLENATAGGTERYTRRLGTGVLGVVVRREEREERERRRNRATFVALAAALVALAAATALWRAGTIQAAVATILEKLG